ncbi:MAG: malectin domain-containing carbohydrate-binding protein [Leeuwenhoekiella sp.]
MKKQLFKFVQGLLLLLFILPLQAQTEIPDNKGKEFWVMFNANEGTPSLKLFITGEISTDGAVELPDGTLLPFSIVPGLVNTIDIPSTLMVTVADGIENKGIRVFANNEVTVYGLNQRNATTDAFLALPVDILDTEYLIMSYPNLSTAFASLMGVVAIEDNTEVEIIPASNAGIRSSGIPYTIVLNKGETYQLRATGSSSNDLTGTSVTSDKPIAVFGGHVCANVPPGVPFCDHMIEQMPPSSSYGQQFVTTPLATRTSGDIFRVLASQDNTAVTVTGTNGFSGSFTLNTSEFEELDIPSDEFVEIVSSAPVLLAQYSKGQNSDGIVSDPFMMLIPPFEQFQNGYTVTTPATGFNKHFINLAVPNSQVGSVSVDGSPIDASEFTAIASSGFSGAQVEISAGTHNINGISPFGAFMYGFGSFDSYGYPGGQALGKVAEVQTIAIIDISDPVVQGKEFCFTTTVENDLGDPLPGIRVDFVVSGTNDAEGFGITDANGEAVFCYTPANGGEDTVTATIGTNSDQTTYTVEMPVPTTLTLDPETVSVVAGEEVCIIGTVLDQVGDPLAGVEVFTEVDGSPVGSMNTDADGEVEYCFTPTTTGTVEVVCYYTGGSPVTSTVTVTPDTVTPVPTSLTLDPDMVSVMAGEEICITGTVLDQFGDPLAGVEVFTEVDGNSVGSMSTDADGEVEYCFTPTTGGVVNIVCYYAGGERVSSMVTVMGDEPTCGKGDAVYRINAGAGAFTYGDVTFEMDQYFDTGYTIDYNEYGTGYPMAELYSSERWSLQHNGSFNYNFPVDNGDYVVVLHFSEVYHGAPGKRIMDVDLEGAQIIDDLDIYGETGGKFIPLIKEFSTSVTDGSLDLLFSATADRPQISAIEIYRTVPCVTGDIAQYRINAGGMSYDHSADLQFMEDGYFDSGNAYMSSTTEVSGTDLDPLFLSERVSSSDLGTFNYSFPVPNGNTRVVLHFAEIYWNAAGQRVMSVKAEGETVVADLDIYAEVGKFSALSRTFEVSVTDGELNLMFSATVNRPKVSAIEVFSVADGITPPPPATATTTTTASLSSSAIGSVGSVKVYPTLVEDSFVVRTSGVLTLTVFDINGRTVIAKRELRSGSNSIAFGDKTKGIYLIQLTGEDGSSATKKLIKR